MSPRTLQRHQKYLSAPLDLAVREGLLPSNPYKPFVIGEKAITELRRGLPDATRKLWHEELGALLATPKWTNPATLITDPIYLVPLIARLGGLRSEEILQLKPENIRQSDGIHYFDIERGTGRGCAPRSTADWLRRAHRIPQGAISWGTRTTTWG